MKSAALVSFAIFLGSIVSAAQTATYGVAGMEGLKPPQAVNKAFIPWWTGFATTPMGCPVSLRAQHGATGGMLQADKSRPNGLAQLLHLTLINPDSRQIVSARVRVHGVSGKARATQALSNADSGDPDIARNLVIQFSSAPGKTVTGDLWVPDMTAVLRIDLNSLTYADGSTRGFTAREACHVAPDLKMLVANH
jgi:hypothetical protein